MVTILNNNYINHDYNKTDNKCNIIEFFYKYYVDTP